ncbi:MAG: hypothetical protein HZB55_07955 [Deltaproteobacteria bacterium]|nr:hypothetical protein [Deltaproteobacteria bacterium]
MRARAGEKPLKASLSDENPLSPILRLTDAFCAARLGPEAAELCHRAAGRLARKRPSPLLRGSPEAWAAGILQAVAAVNCLIGPWGGVTLTIADIADACGVSPGTVASRGRTVRTTLRLEPGDAAWLLSGAQERLPLTVSIRRLFKEARRRT